jgi:hypothetical protein
MGMNVKCFLLLAATMPPKSPGAALGDPKGKAPRPRKQPTLSEQQRNELLAQDQDLLLPHTKALLEARQAFYQQSSFRSKEALLRACLEPGEPQQLLLYLLQLRANHRNRLTLQEFREALDKNGAGRKWWKGLTNALWNTYKVDLRSGPRIKAL